MIPPISNNNLLALFEPYNSDPNNLFTIVNQPMTPSRETASVFDVLLNYSLNKYNATDAGGDVNWDDYAFNQMYLQYPNARIKELADKIVNVSDSNDVKAAKITEWVLRNISYVLDSDNYGVDEMWVPPVMTLNKGTGDCEDGAFLIHSLMLNAGIPWERIRTYGGEVWAGDGAATGGHAWTAYQRESDNEWVVLDSSYFPNVSPVSVRDLMSADERYIDDWFYMDLYHFILADDFNYIREPDAYTAMAMPVHNTTVGAWLSAYA